MSKWFVAAAAAIAIVAIPVAIAASPSKNDQKPATSAQSQSAGDDAAKACKAERKSLGVEAFNKKYGTNHNLKNAFGKCVSGKSKGKKDDKDEKDEDEKDETRRTRTPVPLRRRARRSVRPSVSMPSPRSTGRTTT